MSDVPLNNFPSRWNEQIANSYRVQGKSVQRISRETGFSKRDVRMVLSGAPPEYWYLKGEFLHLRGARLVFAALLAAATRRGDSWRIIAGAALLILLRWMALLLVVFAVPAGLTVSGFLVPLMVLVGAVGGCWCQIVARDRIRRAALGEPRFSEYAGSHRFLRRTGDRLSDKPSLDDMVFHAMILPGLTLLSVVLGLLVFRLG